MSNNFKVGDRVELVRDVTYAIKGMKGTIKLVRESSEPRYAVEFDEPFEGGHYCDGYTKFGHGHWALTSALKPIQKFEVGQVYKVTYDGEELWNIIRITETYMSSNGFKHHKYRIVRGKQPQKERLDFCVDSPFANSLVLLTGSQIGEEIKKWDADHAKKAEPAVKEVKRHARVGEYIKIVDEDCSFGDYHNGDILKVVRNKHAGHFPGAVEVDVPDSAYINASEYVVLEGYKPEKAEPPAEPQEKRRKAKVGEIIRVLEDNGGPVNSGTIWQVVTVRGDGSLSIKNNENSGLWAVSRDNYVVIPSDKHRYTDSQVAEAKRIVLDTIREYAEKDEQITVHRVDDSTSEYEAVIIHHDTELTAVESWSWSCDKPKKEYTFTSEYAVSKCGPNDEPNEWIGKCVAVCKLLGKSIPRFIMENGAEKRFSFEKAQQLCDDGDVVTIRCKDKTEGDLLKAELEKLGVFWKSGEEPTRFDFFDDGYFVVQNGKKLSFNRMKGHDKFVEFSDCFTEI